MIDIVFPDSIKEHIDMLEIHRRKFLYTNAPELKNTEKYLKNIKPLNVLEIGAGLGRSSVFFFKYFDWKDTNFYLLDGDSGKIKHTGVRVDEENGFYSSKRSAEDFCNANGMIKMEYLDAETDDWMFLDITFDVVYSFLAIGFHWPVSLYLDKIYHMLSENAVLMFGIRSKENIYKKFIDKQIESIDINKYSIVDLKLEPKTTRASVLILKKN